MSTCFAKYLLSTVPFFISALHVALTYCGSLLPALNRIMLSCVVWEVAEDAVLSLSVLFSFQSQKDLNRKMGMMGRSRKTLSVSESLLK